MLNLKLISNRLKIKSQMQQKTHYNPHLETRIKCDPSGAGLGAALEQRSSTGWHTVAFASRFLNSNERYSINNFELVEVVWSVEYFKYYLFGKSFTIITDHRALLSIMKEHRSTKSYNSRLTRWVDSKELPQRTPTHNELQGFEVLKQRGQIILK